MLSKDKDAYNKLAAEVARRVIDVFNNRNKKGSSPYDTSATVKRVEGNTAYVHIPGGVDETPVQMAITAKKGDVVRIRVANGAAWIVGNTTAPPTDDAKANTAVVIASAASTTANDAIDSANIAADAAESAQESADKAQKSATDAQIAANDASAQALLAKGSAENANEYAVRAYANLGAVESVADTLEWITNHGTMTNTQDLDPPETSLNPSDVYFVEDDNGEYEVGGERYSLVKEPKSDDIADYYLLTIDKSLNNYVATHLALTGEGLTVVNTDDSDYHMLITNRAVQIIDKTGATIATYGESITLGVGNVVTTVTNQAMTCENIYFRYLYPMGTSLVLEARANGHFSIKPV